MNWYPQIASGAVAQLPLKRQRTWRAIRNEMEGGSLIQLADAAGGEVGWTLRYSGLDEQEMQALSDLFAASCGQFGSFTFLDPLANLFGWSEDLSRADWQTGVLSHTSGATDPIGTTRAIRVANGSAGSQEVLQTLGVAGQIVTCFSFFVRSDIAGSVVVRRDSRREVIAVGQSWARVSLGGIGDSGAEQASYGVALASGQSIDVWGMQVEAQPAASQYKATGAAKGIYEETYFSMDELSASSTAPGLFSCDVTLKSRV